MVVAVVAWCLLAFVLGVVWEDVPSASMSYNRLQIYSPVVGGRVWR